MKVHSLLLPVLALGLMSSSNAEAQRRQSVADRVAFMEDGRLREPPAGDPD